MPRYAVGYMSQFDNDLIVVIVEADDWRSAISKHTQAAGHHFAIASTETLSDVKSAFFDQDAAIDVIEIPPAP